MVRMTALMILMLASGALPPRAAGAEIPSGFFVLRSARDDRAVPTAILEDRNVTGVSLRRSWSSLHPDPGQFAFDYLDREIAAAAARSKKVMLHVDACGDDLPNWVAKHCETFTFVERNRFAPTAGKRSPGPVPWDATYLAAWTDCIRELGHKYAENSTVVAIHVGGPSRRGSETFLPAEIVNVPGYSPEAVLGAWTRIFAAYAEAFPDTAVVLDLAQPTPDRSLPAEQVLTAFELAVPHPVVQHNALAAKTSERYAIHSLIASRGRQGLPIGFQQLCASHHPRHGGLLKTAMETAGQAGARYIEIYDPDRLRLRGPWPGS